jgi:hypothetical protein
MNEESEQQKIKEEGNDVDMNGDDGGEYTDLIHVRAVSSDPALQGAV